MDTFNNCFLVFRFTNEGYLGRNPGSSTFQHPLTAKHKSGSSFDTYVFSREIENLKLRTPGTGMMSGLDIPVLCTQTVLVQTFKLYWIYV